MLLDTLSYTIDSLKHNQIVINNITANKSTCEMYAPYIASGITALITLVVLIFTLRSNRKRIREENLIKLRKEWIQNFSEYCTKVNRLMEGVKSTPYLIINDIQKEERDRYNELSLYYSELDFIVRIDCENMDELKTHIKEYLDCLYLIINHKGSNENNITKNHAAHLFKSEGINIIKEETEKLKKEDSIISKILKRKNE